VSQGVDGVGTIFVIRSRTAFRRWRYLVRFKGDTGNGDTHLHISRFAVMTSTVVLELIGLFAGWLSALKASRLDPIDALRYG